MNKQGWKRGLSLLLSLLMVLAIMPFHVFAGGRYSGIVDIRDRWPRDIWEFKDNPDITCVLIKDPGRERHRRVGEKEPPHTLVVGAKYGDYSEEENFIDLRLNRVTFEFKASQGTLPDALKNTAPKPYGVYVRESPDGWEKGPIYSPKGPQDPTPTKWKDPSNGNEWKFKGWEQNQKDKWFLGRQLPNYSFDDFDEYWNSVRFTGTWYMLSKKQELDKAIKAADGLTKADVVANNGENVPAFRTWVAQSVDETLKSTLKTAKEKFNNDEAPQGEVDAAANALKAAVAAYKPQPGQRTYDKNPGYNKPQNAHKVTFAKGSGVDMEGENTFFYVKNNTALPEGEFPKATAQNGFGTKIYWSPAQDTAITKDETFTASAKAVNKTDLAAKIQEAEGLLEKDKTSDPALALKTKVDEAKAMVGAVDNGTQRDQDQVDGKASELSQAIQGLKDLNTKKEDAKNAIATIDGLKQGDITALQGEVDRAKNADAVVAIQTKATARGKANKALEEATALVAKAEEKKTQTAYDAAKEKVDALDNGDSKTKLQGRLADVDKYVKADQALDALEGKQIDKISQDELTEAGKLIGKVKEAWRQDLTNRLNSLQNKKTADDQLKAAETAVATLEQDGAQVTKEAVQEARNKINAVSDTSKKEALEKRLKEVEAQDAANKALAALEGKNGDVKDKDITDAKGLIDKVTNQEKKEGFNGRLENVKKAKAEKDAQDAAEDAVKALEDKKGNVKDKDITDAKGLIDKVTNQEKKEGFNGRLENVKKAKAEKDAQDAAEAAVKALEDKKGDVTKGELDEAKEKVNKVTDDTKKNDFNGRLGEVEKAKGLQDDAESVLTALEAKKGAVTDEDIQGAKDKIDKVSNENKKQDFNGRLENVKKAQKAKQTEDAAQQAAQEALNGLTGDNITDENIQAAQDKINNVTDPTKKNELQGKLDAIKEAKAEKDAEAAVKALEDKNGNVTEGEINSAKEKVKKVTNDTKKNDLNRRIGDVEQAKAKKEAEEKAQQEAQNALNGLTGNNITDETIKAAQEKINKVTDEAKKKELQGKLDEIAAEKAVKDLEDKKGNVTDEEIQGAKDKIEKVHDTDKKNNLTQRIGDVEKAKQAHDADEKAIDEADKALNELLKPDANVTDEAIRDAQEKINKVTDPDEKAKLQRGLDDIIEAKAQLDAEKAVAALEKPDAIVTDQAVQDAQGKINKVKTEEKKQGYQGRLDKVVKDQQAKAKKEAEEKAQQDAQNALDGLTGDNITDETIKDAQNKINQVTDEAKKNELQGKLDEIAAEKAVKDLEDKKGNVTDEEIQGAKDKIDKVKDTDKKNDLTRRIGEVEKAKQAHDTEAKAEKAAQDALNGLTGDNITDETIKAAQEKIDQVTDPTKKDELQGKLDEIKNKKAAADALQAEKTKAKAIINSLDTLSGEEKTGYTAQVDQAATSDAIQNIVLAAQKANAKKKVAAMTKLTDPERQAADEAIEGANDETTINNAVQRADEQNTAHQNLEEQKDAAKEKVKGLDKLTPEEKDAYKGRIDQADNTNDVKNIVIEAQKDNAKKKIDGMDKLTPGEKEAAKNAVQNAADENGINTAVTDAQTKQDQAVQAETLQKEKNKAKEKVNGLDQLTSEEKDAYKGRIDQADNTNDVKNIVLEAQKDNAKKKIDRMDKLTPGEKEAAKHAVENAADETGINTAVTNAQTKQEQHARPHERRDQGNYLSLTPVLSSSTEQKSVQKTEPKAHDTVVKKAYTMGYKDGSFRPQANMTRAEAAAMLARLAKLDLNQTAGNHFKDVANDWSKAGIDAVVKAGYMKGYPDGTFHPNSKITRAEFAQMIKAMDRGNDAQAPFKDIQGHWAAVAIAQAYGNGRIKGYPDGTFHPNDNITRAEAVTMFNNLYNRKVDSKGLASVRSDIVDFNDVSPRHWAYYQVVVASHTAEFYYADKEQTNETWVRVLQSWKDAK